MQQLIHSAQRAATLVLSAFFLIFTVSVAAQSGIEFLGQPTGIPDRATSEGALSEVLAGLDQGCKDSSLAEARDKLAKKIAKGEVTEESDKFLKERGKRYFKCLKKAVKELKKDDVISKDEEKILKDIVKAAKKAGNIDDEPAGPVGTVHGRVTLADGSLLDDVDILASSDMDDEVAVTSGGRFSLGLDPDTEYVLQLSGSGLADQIVPVRSPADLSAINIEITMIARGESQTFTAGAGSVLVGDDGAAVDVTSTLWMDAEGNPVSGDIVATITPVDVSNGALLGAFPGEFNGVAAGELEEGAIVSLGVVEFEFTQNGAPVQPVGGLVDILIPIYFTVNQDGSPIEEGQIIPLWSLNEDTGIWEQDGEGVVIESPASPSGWAMLASVSHFSWWNCDVSMNAATAFVTVFGDQPGTAVVSATTDAPIGWRPNTVDTVLPVGETSGALNIPSTGEVCFSAEITFDDGSTASTLEECVTPAPNGTEIIDLFAPVVGPLNIASTPSTGTINGFVNFPIERVRVFPTTLESAVSYTIVSGGLPAGMNLVQINPTKVEISGTPTETGVFSVTLEGDNGAETDTIVIDYLISSGQPPPVFDDFGGEGLFFDLPNVGDVHDFNDDLDLTEGGTADSWELIADDFGALPDWFEFDAAAGTLTLIAEPDGGEEGGFYFARIRAINSSGQDTTFFEVCAGASCFFEAAN